MGRTGGGSRTDRVDTESARGPPVGAATAGALGFVNRLFAKYQPSDARTDLASWPPSGTTRASSSVSFSITDDGDVELLELFAECEPEELLDGHVLGDKWRLVERQGTVSTYGRFYLAEHSVLGMPVGVKILRRQLTETAHGRHLFYEEAMRVSLLHHPNIVQVFDYGEEVGQPYFVMEYLRGRPLTETELTLHEGIEVLSQVARALAYAHEGDVDRDPLVHLDVKPEHIFVDRGSDRHAGRLDVRVIDFGIAEIAMSPEDGEGGAKHGVKGTLPYMAPERFEGVVDARSDVYSLGVILYLLVAGRLPFEGERFEDWRQLHETEVPEPPSRVAQGLPSRAARSLDRLILSTLEKDVEDRIGSARALHDALEDWLSRERQRERRLSPSAVVGRLGVLLVVLATLGLGVWWWGPWDAVDVSVVHRPLGRAGHDIDGRVTGWGYADADVYLAIERGPDEEWIPIGSVDDRGVVRASWPDGEDIQARLLRRDAEQFSGAIVVEGAWGRTIRSDRFERGLDMDPPSRVVIRGGAYREAEGSIFLPHRRVDLTIACDEPLDSVRSTCDRHDVEPDGDALRVSVSSDIDELRFVLADRAGNTSALRLSVRRYHDPHWAVAPDAGARIATRLPEHELELEVDYGGIRGRARVSIDEHVVYDGAEQTIRVPVSLTNTHERKEVVVRVWGAGRGSDEEPSDERQFSIERWQRSLFVEPYREIRRDALPRFRVVDGAGAPIDTFRVEVELDRLTRTGPKRLSGVEFEADTGRLRTAGELPKGAYRLVVRARDEFGNEAPPFAIDRFFYPSVPEIRSFAWTPTSGGGAPSFYRMLSEFEGAKKGPADDDTVSFAATVRYRDLEQLAIGLVRVEAGATESRESLHSVVTRRGDEFLLTMSRRQLIETLEEGSHRLAIEVEDRAHPGLTARREISVAVGALSVDVEPPSGTIAAGTAAVELRIRARGPIARLAVDGQDVEIPPGELLRVPRSIESRGTEVEVEARTTDGRRHIVRRFYVPRPRTGQSFVFDGAGALRGGRLTWTYFDGSKGVEAFWMASGDTVREIVRRYRVASRSSRVNARGTFSVTLREAERIGRWARSQLGIESTGEAPIPYFSQVLALWRQGLWSAESEWLLDGPTAEADPAVYSASVAVREPGGIPKRWNESATAARHEFRILLPASAFRVQDSVSGLR